MKELKVAAIERGTVIDHIPADQAFRVVDLLGLGNASSMLSVATNLNSTSGKKGIIKISGKELNEKETDIIALFAPEATINIIENFEVKEKRKVSLPKSLSGLIRCFNPNCITNKEDVKTMFLLADKKPLQIRCHHCERLMGRDDIQLR